jgi:hypothetical protein
MPGLSEKAAFVLLASAGHCCGSRAASGQNATGEATGGNVGFLQGGSRRSHQAIIHGSMLCTPWPSKILLICRAAPVALGGAEIERLQLAA